ncbi:hypothetical protein ACF0H5_010964 [Mactra antiquata]
MKDYDVQRVYSNIDLCLFRVDRNVEPVSQSKHERALHCLVPFSQATKFTSGTKVRVPGDEAQASDCSVKLAPVLNIITIIFFL